MIELPPPLIIPTPGIIRPAEHSLLQPGGFPRFATREERRAAISDLVRSGRLTPREAKQAVVFFCPTPFISARPVLKSLSIANTSSGNGSTVTLPTGHQAGDVVVVALMPSSALSSPPDVPTMSGFTLLATASSLNGGTKGNFQAKALDGSESDTHTGSTAGTHDFGNDWACALLRGDAPITSFTARGVQQAGSNAANPPAQTITASSTPSLPVYLFGGARSNTGGTLTSTLSTLLYNRSDLVYVYHEVFNSSPADRNIDSGSVNQWVQMSGYLTFNDAA